MAPNPERKALDNLKTHAHHMRILREGTKNAKKHVLKTASPAFVDALVTATRLAHAHGHKFLPGHEQRVRRLMSPSVSKANKKILVSGKDGSYSRGGGFFEDISHAMHNIAPALSHIGHDIEHGAKKIAHDIANDATVKKIAHDIENDATVKEVAKFAKGHGRQIAKMAIPLAAGVAASSAGAGPLGGIVARTATAEALKQSGLGMKKGKKGRAGKSRKAPKKMKGSGVRFMYGGKPNGFL